MTTSPASLKESNKPSKAEVDKEREHIARMVQDVNSPHSAADQVGDDPETWTPDQVAELYDDIMNVIERGENVQLSDDDQRVSEQELGCVTAWTAALSSAEQDSTVAEHDLQQMPGPTAVETPGKENASREDRQTHNPGRNAAVRKDPFSLDSETDVASFMSRKYGSHSQFNQATTTLSHENSPHQVEKHIASIACWSTRQLLQTPHVDRIKILEQEIRDELAEQENLLQVLTGAQHAQKCWIDRATSYENCLIQDEVLDISGINFQSVRKQDMLARQLELIKRVFSEQKPLSANVGIEEVRNYNEQLDTGALKLQLRVLRHWTSELHQQLANQGYLSQDNKSISSVIEEQSFHMIGNTAGVHRGPSMSLPTSSGQISEAANVFDRVQHTVCEGLHQHLQRGREANKLQTSREGSTEILHQNVAQDQQPHSNISPVQTQSFRGFDSRSFPKDSAFGRYDVYPVEMLESTNAPALVTRSDASKRNDPFSTERQEQTSSVFNTMRPHYTQYQGIFAPPRANSTAVVGSRRPRVIALTKRPGPGAPRIVMFPMAPPSDTPLSARAEYDDEEVLNSFPEHLSVPEVMKRFVRYGREHSSGWQTRKMVDCLLRHLNNKDYAGISEGERRENLSRWVVKERDACNNKIRQGSGIEKTTTGIRPNRH